MRLRTVCAGHPVPMGGISIGIVVVLLIVLVALIAAAYVFGFPLWFARTSQEGDDLIGETDEEGSRPVYREVEPEEDVRIVGGGRFPEAGRG